MLTIKDIEHGLQLLAKLTPLEPPLDDGAWVNPSSEFSDSYKAWLDWLCGTKDDKSDDKRAMLLLLAASKLNEEERLKDQW